MIGLYFKITLRLAMIADFAGLEYFSNLEYSLSNLHNEHGLPV
jgi:hypothetical protein